MPWPAWPRDRHTWRAERVSTGITGTVAGVNYAPAFAYQDFQYFLTQGNGPWGTRTWTYDKIGNRLSFARASEPTQTYAYASPGHNPKLSTITPAPGWGTGAWSFSYDAAGNQTSIAESNDEGAVQTTVYDFAGDSRMNAMRTTSPTGPARTDVLYDGRGFLRQAHLTVTGSGDNLKVTPVYSSGGMLMARTEERTWTGGTTGPDGEDQTFAWLVTDTTQLFYFAGRPVAQLTNPGAELLYITTDHLGTPALVTNGGGTATWAGGLEPFGAPWTAGLDRPDPEPVSSGGGRFRLATAALERLSMEKVFLRYPGQWSSDAFRVGAAQGDVYYNLHRWYQTGTGRYSQGDRYLPVSWKDPNLFVYSRARPLVLTDPKGLFVIDDSCDCTPPWSPAENIPRAIGEAGNFPGSPKCQAILQQYRVWPCVPNRFGPDEIGNGPTIKCQQNPPGTDNCGETSPPFLGLPLTIHLYPGRPACPRNSPGAGISVTLFHETVHSCGGGLTESDVAEITSVCTGFD